MTMNKELTPERTALVPYITEMRALFNGRVVGPGDADYDEARAVFFRGIDRRPAAIIYAAGVADVARAISLARNSGLELAVRGGGHSVIGHSTTEGGILLDMTGFKAIDIDVEGRTAWAGAGLTAAEYTNAAGAYGLATGFGDTGDVGIGGLTLGGGIGLLVRKYGLTIDDLLAAEIVTADGQLLTASADSHPDLFWAIRGGGGNFGVVTRFRFRLHEVGQVVGGMLILPATARTIASFITLARGAPDELSTIANIMVAPPMPFLPPEAHGQMMMMLMMVYAGDAAEGQRVLAPIRALATPYADMMRPMPYPDIYKFSEGGPAPVEDANRSVFLDTVDRDLAEEIITRLRASTAHMSIAQLRVLGGAVARVPVEATAFAHRNRPIAAAVTTLYADPAEAPTHEAWADDLAAVLRQGPPGAYVNFIGDKDPERVQAAYPGATWERLAAVKARYDPDNLFRHNYNIPPAKG